jgi:hypothetical protein
VNWNPSSPPFEGRLAVVGGQCSKAGKTTLVVALIQAMNDFDWTAVKITPHVESGCPLNGPACSCGPQEHEFAIHEEHDAGGNQDTSRFLSAGARRAIWLQTKAGHLSTALPMLAATVAGAGHVIVESNSIVEFWRPNLFLMVVDPAQADFKSSARKALELADAFVFNSPFFAPGSTHPLLREIARKPNFIQVPGQGLSQDMQIFARQRIGGPSHPR